MHVAIVVVTNVELILGVIVLHIEILLAALRRHVCVAVVVRVICRR